MLALSLWVSTVAALEVRSFLKTERYFAPLFPFTALVFASWYHESGRLSTPLQTIGWTAACVCGLSGLAAYLFFPPFTRDSQIAAFLKHHRLAGEPVVLLANHAARVLSLRHYYPENQIQVIVNNFSSVLPKFNHRIWVIISPDTQQLRSVLLSHDDVQGCSVQSQKFVQSGLLEISVRK